MLLKTQRNQFFKKLVDVGVQPSSFAESVGDKLYRLDFEGPGKELYFEVRRNGPKESRDFTIRVVPGIYQEVATYKEDHWENGSYGVWPLFCTWAEEVSQEINAPDLWLEASKAVQFFESAADPTDDKFTMAELGALHGQLRMLGQLFEDSELLREYQQELAELTQTAAVKAETFTKKDWQNWVKGAFVSIITSLELDEAQVQELLALVRLAFGGLFLAQ